MRPTQHERWMKTALALAAKGQYSTSPNPMVGACVVKGGRLIASGYHQEFGGPHAERIALERSGCGAKGATLYVTLEPCATWQKTPPCAPWIADKGIKQVVIGAEDPNPLNHKKGIRCLRERGVKVVTGILEDEVKKQNEGFFKMMTAKRPFVTLKMAETLDGKIATREGLSRWISSLRSRKFVHQLRTMHDAVLVGKNTFYTDDPRIAVTPKAKCLAYGKPWRVVMVSEKGWSAKARIFRDDRLTVLVFPESKTKAILKVADKIRGHFALLPVKEAKGRISVPDLLRKLGSIGVTKLLVEGGGELAWSFIKNGCVDRAIWIIAPKIFGGRDSKTSVEGEGVGRPNQAYLFMAKKILRSGGDWILDGVFQKKG